MAKSRYRLALESQLLAEKKWILNALESIKNQRNCLQIERLQLESMKNKGPITLREKSSLHENLESNVVESIPGTSLSLNKMQSVSGVEGTCAAPAQDRINFFETEALCNNEKLDLGVTKPRHMTMEELNAMECEDDYEEDDEDIFIDMNMLMHGDPKL